MRPRTSRASGLIDPWAIAQGTGSLRCAVAPSALERWSQREVAVGTHDHFGDVNAGGTGDGPQHRVGDVLRRAEVIGHGRPSPLEHGVGESLPFHHLVKAVVSAA